MSTVNAIEKSRLSVKVQAVAALAAIVGAVAVPQIFHFLGAVSGMGTVPGEVFLPMHLPVILAGLLAGPFAGAIAGLFGPLASFALSGMPAAAMLPFMMIELFGYGLAAGLLRTVKMPVLAKVLITQAAGRILRAGAVLTAVYALGNENVAVSSIWLTIKTGMFGLALQWLLIPLIISCVNNSGKTDRDEQ